MLFRSQKNSFSRFFQYTLCCLLFCWTCASLAHDEAKIAVVNLDYLVANSAQGKALSKQLSDFQHQVKDDMKSMNQQVQTIRRQLTENTASLSESERNQLQQQYDDLVTKMNQLRDEKTREGQKMQEKGLKQIEKQMEPIFKEFQNDNGYDLILNNVPGVVVLAGDKVNVTEQLLQLLNSQ